MSQTTERTAASVLYRSLEAFLSHEDTYEVLQQLTEHTAEIVGYDDAATLLRDGRGFGLAATTSPQARAFEAWQLERDDGGPSTTAFASGQIVTVGDIWGAVPRWPSWAQGALATGYAEVAVIPLRIGESVIGALTLMAKDTRPPIDEPLVRQLAQLVSLVVALESKRRSAVEVADQLQHALTSRVLIEQAKGMVAESLGITPDEAFARLRHGARSTGRRLNDVARDVVARRDALGLSPRT